MHYLRYYSIGNPHSLKANMQDCKIVISEFKPQSCCYIHFCINSLGKGMDPLYCPSYGLNITTICLLGGWLWH